VVVSRWLAGNPRGGGISTRFAQTCSTLYLQVENVIFNALEGSVPRATRTEPS
jgi:hypothetical protein